MTAKWMIHSALRLFICMTAVTTSALALGDISSATTFIVQAPCTFEAAVGIADERLTCGTLHVPENRNDDDSRKISLPVAVIRTTAKAARPDPVVFIAGGPGGSPIASKRTFDLFASHAFNKDRDIVLYTQRGGALTEPELSCSAIQSRGQVYLADHSLGERDKAISGMAVRCLQELAESDIDLAGYSAQQSAQDLVDLRRALGYPEWNLLAVSYGTLIAIETNRLDPEGIRSMVLDSLVPPESDVFMSEGNRNFHEALQRLLEACAGDPDCNTQFPGLSASLSAVMSRLHDAAISLPLAQAPPGDGIVMAVNWHDFLGLIHWMMYNARTLTLVPLLISETAAARYDLLSALLERVFPGPMISDTSPAGTFFATTCQDQWTRRNPVPGASEHFDGYSMASFLSRACSDPALDYGKAAAPAPISFDTPALLLSGHFDPITPDIYADQVAAVATNASIIRIPDYGHSTLSGYTECQTDLAKSFLDEPRDMAEFECLATLGPPVFVLSLEQAAALFAPAN